MKVNRVARKDYICDSCDQPIFKGETYSHHKYKVPRLNGQDKQIGIEYLSFRQHLPDPIPCYWTEECKKGNHNILTTTNHYLGDEFQICIECGYTLEELVLINYNKDEPKDKTDIDLP